MVTYRSEFKRETVAERLSGEKKQSQICRERKTGVQASSTASVAAWGVREYQTSYWTPSGSSNETNAE